MRSSTVARFVTALALGYSLLHFAASGIRWPLGSPSLAKFDEHAAPLREHLATGRPVHSVHPAQYGPVFFFVMHPLLRATSDPDTLAHWLYAIQLVAIAGSFALTWLALAPLHGNREWLLLAWLAIVWLNFSPFYTILSQKTVETWELLLISIGLFAWLRERRWMAGTAIAAAGLIKVLPFAFLFYWLFVDRRTFWRAIVALAALLAVGHLLYGPEMGAGYLPRIIASATGGSYGLTFHENISLKAVFAKVLGTLDLPGHAPGNPSGYMIRLEGTRATVVAVAGDLLVLGGIVALAISWRQRGTRTAIRALSEWSLLAVAVLILAPNTTFEYITLALGAVSYAIAAAWIDPARDRSTRVALIAALVLLGAVLPRSLLNVIVFVGAINRWTGYTHFTPSEAYQYYEFPLLGLVLLAWPIWRLRPRATDGSIPP